MTIYILTWPRGREVFTDPKAAAARYDELLAAGFTPTLDAESPVA